MSDSNEPSTPALEQTTGTRFERLIQIMRTLRSSKGCPWDRAQTLASLRPFVLEETYEVLDALDRGDLTDLQAELGDLLFQVVFLCQVAAESGTFTVDDAIEAITNKLVRRHPHVFGPHGGTPVTRLSTSSEVREQWEALKAEERAEAGRPENLLEGVPATLPALLRAFEIGARVASIGFDWKTSANVVDKIEEEVEELRQAVNADTTERCEEEMGDLLFSIANLSRKLGIEPEGALRRANQKFCDRFERLVKRLRAVGRSLQDASFEEMEAAWQTAKKES